MNNHHVKFIIHDEDASEQSKVEQLECALAPAVRAMAKHVEDTILESMVLLKELPVPKLEWAQIDEYVQGYRIQGVL